MAACLIAAGCMTSDKEHASPYERCGDDYGRPGHWVGSVVDQQGVPVPGAVVKVWAYGFEPWKDSSPDENAKRLPRGKWLTGFSFAADSDGRVDCTSIYTGRKIEITRYSDANEMPNTIDNTHETVILGQQPNRRGRHLDSANHHEHPIPQLRDSTGRDGYRMADSWGPSSPSFTSDDTESSSPASGSNWHTVIDTYFTHGRWLAISVSAEGYQTHHFFLQPDKPDGSLGTIQLTKLNPSQENAR